ncbi:hypothetical protein Ancab_016382 [Ancistrocladus abbreviatus]
MAASVQFLLFVFLINFTSVTRCTSTLVDNYIIHMDLAAMPGVFTDHHSWFKSIVDSSRFPTTTKSSTTTDSSVLASKLLYTYTHVIHGFSASLTPSELDVLRNSPGYIYSIRDLPVKVDTTHTSKFLGLTSASGAWPASDYGKDIIIGLVDTGVCPESKSFNDDGMTEIPARWQGMCKEGIQFNSSLCNRKLIGARFYNKGLIAKNPNLTISVNSTRDTDGHGTHTSTTAAGNFVQGASYFGYAPGTAVGMAPHARVAMYKALWKEGTYTSDIIAAIDQAIMDGVDILSLSFGFDVLHLYEDPTAIATFAAVEKGIFVTTSAGNEGPSLGTLHNGTPWVITIAAGTADRKFGGVVTLGNGVSIMGLTLYPESPALIRRTLIFMDSCNDVRKLEKIGSKIAVCLDKNHILSDQLSKAHQAKVAGGVFITNNSDLNFFLQTSFPAIFINFQNGDTLLSYIKRSSKPIASLDLQTTYLGTKPAPSVASYSSRGPSPSCPIVLKPDLMAPGDMILASWPQNISVTDIDSGSLFSDFNLLSGTSMACPHAAGVAALLKAAHPDWSPAAIRSAMMTTSDMEDNTNRPIKGMGFSNQPATPLAMGAGHINPNNALKPGLVYDAEVQDYVNLLCALNYTTKQIKIITRSSHLINCSSPSSDLNYPSFIAFFNGHDSSSDTEIVHEFWRTVTNVGEGMSTYTAKVTPIDGVKVNVEPGILSFREKYEKARFKLTVKGSRVMKQKVVYGSLSWVDTKKNYVVRSPIVATTLSFKNKKGRST